MNKLICSIVASLAVATSLYAGPQKTVVAPAPSVASPFYIALDGGINLAQNGLPSHGLDSMQKMGWSAGLKIGYDFNTLCDGLITPAVEVEGLYTKFDHHWDGVTGYRNTIQNATLKANIGTWAGMANGIAKFNLGSWQPYVGAGVGFFSTSAQESIKVGSVGQFDIGSQDRDGFAWQLLGGVDYKITSNVSVFTEYKWLNCVIRHSGDFVTGSNLGQHLATAGVRYHF